MDNGRCLFSRAVLVLGAAGLFLAPCIQAAHAADTVAPAGASEQVASNPAGQFIQDLGNKALGVITDKSLSADQRSGKYRELLRAAFDMPTIGRFVLGRAWSTATPQQQQEYLKLFESLVVKIYGDRLNFYNGENFKVTGVRAESDRDIVVNSEITHPGAAPTTIDWRVRKEDNRLAVVDVIIEGVSQSVTQRQEYASILERNNGNIDALLNMMRQNLQQGPTTSP